MRIFITGAQGVGKTTLNFELQKLEQFKSLNVLDSVSKKFATSVEDFKDPNKLKQFQVKVSSYCIMKYLEDNFISSRGFADMYAYNSYQFDKDHQDIFYHFAMMSINLAEELRSPQDIHIYIPPMFDLEDNGMRSTNKEFQLEIDQLIRDYYEITGLDFLEIKSLDLNDRVQEVLDYIKEKTNEVQS